MGEFNSICSLNYMRIAHVLSRRFRPHCRRQLAENEVVAAFFPVSTTSHITSLELDVRSIFYWELQASRRRLVFSAHPRLKHLIKNSVVQMCIEFSMFIVCIYRYSMFSKLMTQGSRS